MQRKKCCDDLKRTLGLDEEATEALLQQIESLQKHVGLSWQRIEAVIVSRAHRTVSLLTKQHEIEVKLDDATAPVRRRDREFIEPRGAPIFQPGTDGPSGGARVLPIRIN